MIAINLLLMTGIAHAEPSTSTIPWTKEKAETLGQGEKEVGIFGPLRLGLANDWELQVQPLLIFVAPGAQAKKTLWSEGDHKIAITSGAIYPAPLLNILGKAGIGGILAPDIQIPKRPKLKIIGHYTWQPNKHAMTIWQRIDAVPFAGSYDESEVINEGGFPYTSIDAPLAYSRTAVLRSGLALQTGLVFDGSFHPRWEYEWRSSFWMLPTMDEHRWSYEEQTLLRFLIKPNRALQVGTIFTISDFPYGKQWHLLPTVDMRWHW